MAGDIRQVEEMAIRMYQQSDRTGVEWVRRPEWLKQSFREAARRRLRGPRSPNTFDPVAAGLPKQRN